MKPLTFGSLFSGCGGMDLGFERAGLKCVWQAEINDYARRVLDKHWPGIRRHDDIRTLQPDASWRCDIVAGGDPCQENSGARAGDNCTQSSLGGEFIRIVDAIRPRIVLRENPTFVRKDAPWPWWRMRSALESIGYAVLPFRLRACCFGAFHQRDRLFLLCERTDANRKRLEGREAEAKGWKPREPPRRIHADDWLAVYAPRGIGSRNDVPNFVDRLKGLGNAVVPQVAEWIGRRIIEANNGNHEP